MLDVLVDGVSFSYDKKNVILGNIDMKVEAGSFVCILGQSGCGKSTLLRLLSGLEKPDSGRILIQGSELKEPNLNLGLVFQNQGLFPWMTAGENIDIALKKKFPKMSKDERKESAISYIEEVGLKASCFDKLPKELSGGMQQRCAIARAFSIDPPILLTKEIATPDIKLLLFKHKRLVITPFLMVCLLSPIDLLLSYNKYNSKTFKTLSTYPLLQLIIIKSIKNYNIYKVLNYYRF